MSLARGGAWWLAAAAALGCVVALLAWSGRGSGVDHTAGALLVVISTALLALAGVALALWRRSPGLLRGVLWTLSLLDVLGTFAAAWFLHEWGLAGLMALASLSWVAAVAAGSGRATRLERSGA